MEHAYTIENNIKQVAKLYVHRYKFNYKKEGTREN